MAATGPPPSPLPHTSLLPPATLAGLGYPQQLELIVKEGSNYLEGKQEEKDAFSDLCNAFWQAHKIKQASIDYRNTKHIEVVQKVSAILKREDTATNVGLLRGVLALMAILTRNKENGAYVIEEGIVELVVDFMGKYLDDIDVQTNGCWTLRNLAWAKPAAVIGKGGVECTLSAMEKHKLCPDLQQMGCSALGEMIISDNAAKVAQQKGIDIVVEAMTNHKGHAEVEEQGGLALWTFSLYLEAELASAGVIECVIDALKRSKSSAPVQTSGFTVLGNISLKGDFVRRITDKGAIKLAVEAIKNHTAHTEVLESACFALRNFIVDKSNYGSSQVDEEVIISVLDVMKHNKKSEQVLQHACVVIRNCAIKQETSACIEKIGGVEQVIETMNNHRESPEIQLFCCGALQNFTCHESSTMRVVEKGGVISVFNAMAQFSGNSSIMACCCSCLNNIMINQGRNYSTKTHLLLNYEKALGYIIDAMNNNPNDAQVQERGCAALRNIVEKSGTHLVLAQKGGLECVINAIARHKEKNVQTWGIELLDHFSGNDVWLRGSVERVSATLAKHGWENKFGMIRDIILLKMATIFELDSTPGCTREAVLSLKNICLKTIVLNPQIFPKDELPKYLPEELCEDVTYVETIRSLLPSQEKAVQTESEAPAPP